MISRRRDLVAAICGIALALLGAGLINGNPVQTLRFRLGLYGNGERIKVEETIKHFNRDYATLYNTGGPTTMLGSFPADNLVKRRIFQEVRYWDQLNAVMVYDKESVKTTRIDFPAADRAVVVADEVWFICAQKVDTRERISTLKRNPVRIRYLLRLVRGKWRVSDFEVYNEGETLPVLAVNQ